MATAYKPMFMMVSPKELVAVKPGTNRSLKLDATHQNSNHIIEAGTYLQYATNKASLNRAEEVGLGAGSRGPDPDRKTSGAGDCPAQPARPLHHWSDPSAKSNRVAHSADTPDGTHR